MTVCINCTTLPRVREANCLPLIYNTLGEFIMFYSKTIAQQRFQIFGDLHGTKKWRTLLDTSADKIIFLGDYVDSHAEISDRQIVDNLCDLLLLKINYEDKVVLLWGNHDLAYFRPDVFKCSGHRPSYELTLHKLFKTNYELLQAAYQQKNYLFTHAGLSRRFWQDDVRGEETDYAHALNYKFLFEPAVFGKASHYRGGAGNYGSIFWADIHEFYARSNWIAGLNQIVGHQPVRWITFHKWQNSTMLWLDTWSNPNSSTDAVLELEI
jgi:predicted MPP superfamily phosphohydrolase